MTKKKSLSYKGKITRAISRLPCPLFDKKHGIIIYFVDNRARSNESRYEHIGSPRHNLQPRDIERIAAKINDSELRQDKERSNTYNLYISRNNYNKEYIKISLDIDFNISNEATVKTIFITKNKK